MNKKQDRMQSKQNSGVLEGESDDDENNSASAQSSATENERVPAFSFAKLW